MASKQHNNDDNNSFLGRGWSFPVRFSKRSRIAELSEDEQDIRESLEILLGTERGERVMNPKFGTNVKGKIFEPLRTSSAARITEDIRRAVQRHEPRVNLEDVSFRQDPEEGFILVIVEYTIISTNTRTNMVYPYYFTEGTDITT